MRDPLDKRWSSGYVERGDILLQQGSSVGLPIAINREAERRDKKCCEKGRRAVEDGLACTLLGADDEMNYQPVCNEWEGGQQLNRLICITISRDIISFRCRQCCQQPVHAVTL